MKIGLVDYEIGNLGSVLRSFHLLGVEIERVRDPSESQNYSSLILPGVGAFSDCVLNLKKYGWFDFFKNDFDSERWPLLGICVGMQMLLEESEESFSAGSQPSKGLGIISGHVRKLSKFGCNERIPHIGWNSILLEDSDSSILENINSGTDYYFVHSFAASLEKKENLIAKCNYGIDFPAVIGAKNIFGTQFHPEKSSKAGAKIFKNFARLSDA